MIMENNEYSDDRKHTGKYFLGIFGQSMCKFSCHIMGGDDGWYFHSRVAGIGWMIEDAKQQYHQNRTDTAQCNQAETVISTLLIAAGRG